MTKTLCLADADNLGLKSPIYCREFCLWAMSLERTPSTQDLRFLLLLALGVC